jgi:hypothetical protein
MKHLEVNGLFDSPHSNLAVWTSPVTGIIIAQISFEETELLFNFFEGGDPCTLLG